MEKASVDHDRERLRIMRQSGWCIDDLSGVTWIPVKELYEILSGLYDPPTSAKARIAKALGCEVEEIFP
jgi:hypothetical protein